MSLAQFWRILWARKFLILAATFFSLAGGIVASIVIPPRWKAEAHVYLNLLKPDPVTGEVLGPSARSYVATQIKLITDYSVTGLAVDKLGWLSDPNLIQAYQNRSKSDTRDFRRWLAQLIADRTKAEVPDGSNILDITYTGDNPDSAKIVANAVTQAYLDTSVAFRRAEAQRNVVWFTQQAQKVKAALESAQATETQYERENGVTMQDTEIDSARLAALSDQNGALAGGGGSSGETQLAQLDAEIRQKAQTLGPNHPDMIALKAKRAALAASLAQQASPRFVDNSPRIAAQRAQLIATRNKLAKLSILQSEVDIRKDEYNKTVAKLAEFQQQAAVVDSGLTPLGTAAVPPSPSFPNPYLIIGGSFALGLGFGILVALLIELLDRRVRSPEDLRAALSLPVLAVLGPSG
jgi:protein tyrosine kinase modulator